MKTNRFTLALLAISLFGAAMVPLSAQEGKSGLTFDHYPYNFSDSNPFTPESPILLQFNAPVNPNEVEGALRLYDKDKERFASVRATRPTIEEIKAMKQSEEESAPLDMFVLIRPASALPLGGTWYINGNAGLASSDGIHALIESSLDYVGEIDEFRIGNILAVNDYDSTLEVVIQHNKGALGDGFDAAKLSEYVTVSPKPEHFEIKPDSHHILLNGKFDYGIDYTITIREGIVAKDTTQLEQVFTQNLSFVPNEGFITYPVFSSTQNASGHRKFDIRTGNLTGMRTRVKHLAGNDLIVALREYSDKYEGWGEKQSLAFEAIPGKIIYDQFLDSTAALDKTETVSLEWDGITKKTQTGAFYLCSEGKSSTRDAHSVGAQSLVQLTDIGLAWKQSDFDTVVYAFSLKTGAPLPGLTVKLVDGTAATLTEAVSDESGIARLEAKHYQDREDTLFLDATLGADRNAMRFYDNLDSLGLWSFNLSQRYEDLIAGERRTLIFTDRNVYRPGDEVKVKSISRFIDTDKLLGAGIGAAKFRVFDARHRKLLEREVTYSANGSVDDAFTLPTEGMGWHSIEIDFNPVLAENEEPDWRLISNYSFQVEDYRVNTFEVTIDSEKEYSEEAALSIPISAKYYMGKPLSKAEVSWMAYAESEFPRPRGFEEFEFGNRTIEEDLFSAEGTQALTSQGEATAKFTLPEQTLHPGPRRISLTASVTDANQQTISASKRFLIHSSDFYLGVRLPEGVFRAGDEALFSLAAVNTAGDAHTEPVQTSVLVEKEIWTTVKVMGANGKMTHRNEQRMETVSDTPIVLKTEVDAATGLTRAMPHRIKFAAAGDYQVTLTARDAKGRNIITRSDFRVIGAEEPSWSWHDVIRIDLIPDKATYAIGDTAKLLARSPVFGHALLTVERGGVRSTKSILIDQYETVLEVPIEEGAAPNLFASLLIIRGSGESPHVYPSADYRLGYCQLDVEDPVVRLTTTISTGDAEYYQPGEEVEFTATVVDHLNQPVAGAEVTFYAVDEGVLSLTGHLTPDPGEVFHEAFPLAVSTGQSLGDLVPENPLEQDFGNKGYVIGGGGVFGLDPDRMRKDFKALAFWEPTLVTDANGVVRAKAIAPDNLTTFRVMAVVAEGNRFGKGETPLVINKPLIIEPALPGFTNLTDQIDISSVLHNNTKSSQEIEVSVALDSHAIFLNQIGETIPTSLPPVRPEANVKTVKLILEANATETLSFPIALTAVGEATWTWKVRSLTEERLRDSIESKIQVGYPLPLLRETHSFALRDGADLKNALDKVAARLLDGHGSIELSLSNSRLVDAAGGLDYLLQYPYGCVEQVTSTLIPWLSTQQLRKVMPKLEKSEEEVASVINKGITRLFSMQTADGGLGYWPGADESVLWGSAYGGVVMALAQKQGITLPEEQSVALWDYLSLALRNSAELNNPYEISQRCLAAYALTLAGVNETPYHEVLFEKRRGLSSEARSLLALAMIESGTAQPERITELLSPDPKVPVAEVSWYRQPYIAATRLLAEVRHNPKSKNIDTLVDQLMNLREAQNGWGSTYSNAWPLLALAAYSEVSASSLSGNEIEVTFDSGTQTVKLPADPKSENVTLTFDGNNPDRALSLRTGSDSPVFVNMRIGTRPALIPLEPENKGFGISRSYQKVQTDGTIVAADDLQVGDLILVTLDLNFPNERETYLAIDDALPAIFEAVNPNFKSQETQRVDTDRNARTFYTTFREIRKDRVLFFADSIYGAGDYNIQYLARVVAPGQVTAPPAKIEAMYEPQRFGLSGTEIIRAKAKQLEPGKVADR